MKLLVTGATGFVGRELCSAARARGDQVRRAIRRPVEDPDPDDVVIGDLAGAVDWGPALEGMEVVIHLAGRAHVLRETNARPAAAFEAVNVAATQSLALAAQAAGVRRLVFASSVKVNGERTVDHPFRESDPPAPEDDYGRSKWAGERAIAAAAAGTRLEWAIVRPVLVHGPGVRGNLHRLLGWLDRRLPLPLGGVRNRRSLVGVQNLADLLLRVATHPAAAGGTFFAADDGDLSTPDLIRLLARGLGRRASLVRVPAAALRLAGRLPGAGEIVDRLTGSLLVDTSRARSQLAWRPPHTLEEGLMRMAAWYRSQSHPV